LIAVDYPREGCALFDILEIGNGDNVMDCDLPSGGDHVTEALRRAIIPRSRGTEYVYRLVRDALGGNTELPETLEPIQPGHHCEISNYAEAWATVCEMWSRFRRYGAHQIDQLLLHLAFRVMLANSC
jgi:hypothetical protein